MQVGDVVALDAQRHLVQIEGLLDLLQRLVAGGEVTGPLGLVQRQRLCRVARDGLHEVLLVAAPGHPYVHLAAAQLREESHQRVQVVWGCGHQNLAGNGIPIAVQLEQEVLDHRGLIAFPARVRVGVVAPVGHPAAWAPDPSPPDVEDLHRHLEWILGQGHDVGVRGVTQHNGLLLQHLVQRTQIVT